MDKFRRREEVIEAQQWFPPGHPRHAPIEGVTPEYRMRLTPKLGDSIPEGAVSLGQNMYYYPDEITGYAAYNSDGSYFKLYDGFWILRTSSGLSVLNPHDFEKMYERLT